MLNGVLTTTVNHTAAEAFLRGAAPGERSAEDEFGYTWTLIDHGDGSWNFYSNLGFFIAVPLGQYTLQYREGMTLTAAEAWDYLAADEARRCRSRFKRVLYRVSGGALQSCDNYPGAAWQGYSQAQTALPGADPYTVAPDAPGEARTGVTAERLARRYVEAFDFGILDDADKLAEWAVDARDALFMAHGELAAERNRVAELERTAGEREDCWGEAHGALQGRLDAALKSLEDTEADLAKAQKRVAELEAENDAIRKRWEETANERDALERYQDAIDYLASELDIIGTPDEIATEARNIIEALRAAAVTLPAPGSPIPEDALRTARRNMLGKQVRLAWVLWASQQANPKPSWLLPWADLSESDREADRCIGEHLESFLRLESFLQNRADRCDALRAVVVTLPDDTTTPLTLMQRALALEIGRRLRVPDGPAHLMFRMTDGVLERFAGGYWGACGDWWVQLADPGCTVTLCPEPAPEPRRLTFAEACRAVLADGARFAFEEYTMERMESEADEPWVAIRRNGGGVWAPNLAMLAAEWVAAS